MGFWDTVKGWFGATPPVTTTPASPAAGPASPKTSAVAVKVAAPPPPPPVKKSAFTLDILASTPEELRKRALKIVPWRTAWIGRVDTIPPQSDERTAIIDRGLILRGYLSEAEIDEIHRIGDLWLEHREAHSLAKTKANESAHAALEALKKERREAREKKREEAKQREARRRAQIAERKKSDIIYLGRGVSAGLNDRRSHIEKLETRGLPMLSTPADVAQAMGVSIPDLRWLCFHSDAATRVHYVTFEAKKKSGGVRMLSSPHKKMAAAQRWVLDNVLAKLTLSDEAHGFVKGRSTVSNARVHCGQALVINLDLSNFFPSIGFRRVRALFKSIGYSPAVATIFALICTESPRRAVKYGDITYHVAIGDRALPQGACTSPTVSNLIASRLDKRLKGFAAKVGARYTRYADDLSFSFTAPPADARERVLSRVRYIAGAEGFELNSKKGRVQGKASQQLVTGLVVNADRPRLNRKERKKLRAIAHNVGKTSIEAQNREKRPHFAAWLAGKIAYVNMTDPALAAKLRAAAKLS